MASNLPGLENILDNLDVGIIIFDNKGTYLFVNKTLLQYTGRTRQDYLNHTVYDFIASGLYKESVVDKVYHEKRAVTQIHVTVSADGKQVGRLVTVSPIFNAQGEIVYAISCQIQVDAMNQKYSHAKAINAIATGIRGNWDDRREVIAKSPHVRRRATLPCSFWENPEPGRRSWPSISTSTAPTEKSRWWLSTAPLSPNPYWRRSSSAMRRVRSPGLNGSERV